ncbi:PREDICTED: disrupted in schizophrenia 1 protein-like, partial [Galeopterus variegatus]|uniref:Disrupted in schizophrenia 1 protein-like n=1 Tax=Galeopterus variegatus TaxID=482537 RepID=A0ABM0QI91_GALVR
MEHRARGVNTQAPLRTEPRPPEPTAEDNVCVSVTKRDWLLQEKQWLQMKIEALQAKMSVLEAKVQQLRREIDRQGERPEWQGCDLVPLMGQLQEVSMAEQDTLATACLIPSCMEPPES